MHGHVAVMRAELLLCFRRWGTTPARGGAECSCLGACTGGQRGMDRISRASSQPRVETLRAPHHSAWCCHASGGGSQLPALLLGVLEDVEGAELEIEDIAFGNIGENNNCRLSDGGSIQEEEPLEPGNFIVTHQSTETDIGNNARNKVPKNQDSVWKKEGTIICPSLENESFSIVKGDCQGPNLRQNNTASQNKLCSSSNPSASRNAKEETNICQLSFENNCSVHSKITFFANDNDQENDLLYYDWSDISNFEDVDQMFRNCDPTFGQWSNTDGPSWMSSSNDMFGPEDTLTSAFESSTLEFKELEKAPGYCENTQHLHDCKTPQVDTHKQSCLTHQSFKSNAEQAYDGGGEDENKSSLTPFSTHNLDEHEPEINIQTQQLNRQFSSDVKGKGLATYPVQLHSKQDCFAKSNSSSFTQSLDPDFHVDNKLLYQDLLLRTTSSTITNCEQDISSSLEVSAPVGNNTFHGMGKVPCPLLNNSVMKLEEMAGRPHIGPPDLGNSVRKHYDNFGQNIHNDQGNMNIELHGTDMDSGVGKSPFMASVLSDDISIKIIRFQQLQGTIGQLDIRTKLCIRDSLYRLARSAEQRHKFDAANAQGADFRTGIYGTGASSRPVEYMDIETETNPIDRSVAHLLFHKAPESVMRTIDDSTSFEAGMM
ncbi:hypothetical protein ZIOFF_008037 [Zingiber officinale]|uniref:Protein LNK1 n=1 Tax=Zingiber officinale TaxID=94328 RepID=A0A8J5HS47_ZINOF|nr:hypothetical protein ZIOFF_008037 [Zingiber officinale]